MTAATISSPSVRRTATPPPLVAGRQRPTFRWSDIWRAPVHDLPIRDEMLYQYFPLSAEMDVLEIGPGSGFTAFRMARRVRSLAVLDVAASSLAYLRQSLRQYPGVRFIHADACAAELPQVIQERFDAIYALEVLELLPDPVACLRNIGALLRPGGRMLVQFPNYPPPRNTGVSYFPERQRLDAALQAAGFEQWQIYSLRLRPFSDLLFRTLHEKPLRLYRRLRGASRDAVQAYDQSWAFQRGNKLGPYKVVLHSAWTALMAACRLGGDCFERTLLAGEIGDRNLLLLARK